LRPVLFHCGLVRFAPFITIKSGFETSASSSSLRRDKHVFLKCACQAASVMKRTERREYPGPHHRRSVDSRQTLPEAAWSQTLSDAARFPERGFVVVRHLCLCRHQRNYREGGIVTDDILIFGERPVKIGIGNSSADLVESTRARPTCRARMSSS